MKSQIIKMVFFSTNKAKNAVVRDSGSSSPSRIRSKNTGK